MVTKEWINQELGTYTETDDEGNKVWYLNGDRHRKDGPAIEYANGDKCWYLNGQLHRTDGPAIEWANGSKSWYLHNQLHREDGPAVENADGSKSWYLHDQKIECDSQEMFERMCKLKAFW